ncbi:hypothetical protein [Shewanella gaetbuli]
MKLLKTSFAVAVALGLSACGSDNTTTPSVRIATVNFTVDKVVNPMTSEEDVMAPFMETCGYVLTANNDVIKDKVCIDDTLNIEVRDGYKLALSHAQLDEALEAPSTEKWSVEGEHTIAVGETNIELVTKNENFTAVSVAGSDHLYDVQINEDVASELEGAVGYYGFVTGEEFKIEIESQLGGYSDVEEAKVNTHFHYQLREGDAGIIAPGEDWEQEIKPIGGETPPFLNRGSVNVVAESISGDTLTATAGAEEGQTPFNKYPNVHAFGLPVEVEADLGWVNIYVYSEAQEKCVVTVESSKITGECEGQEKVTYASLPEAYEALGAEARKDYIEQPVIVGRNIFWRLANGSEGAWEQTGTLTIK